MRSGLFLAGLSALSVLACSCGVGANPSPPSHGPPNTGRVIMNINSPINSLHPFTIDNLNSMTIINLIVEKLVRVDDAGQYHSQLAREWTVSANKKIFTFKLRPGVKWSDGKALTAKDVRFSFQMIFDPKFKAAGLQGIYQGIQRIEIPHTDEIRFHAKRVDAELWKVLATQLRIYPEHFFVQTSVAEWNTKVVGTGPYILTAMETREKILLTKNPNWWGLRDTKLKAMYTYPELLFRVVSDPWAGATMVAKGEFDIFQLRAPSDLELTKSVLDRNALRVRVVRESSRRFARTMGIEMNLRHKFLQRREVRQALNLLFNRKDLAQKVLHGHMQPAVSFFGRTSPFFVDHPETPYDPSRALRLLHSVGFKAPPNSPLLTNAEGAPLKLQILFDDAALEPLLSIFREDAKKMGVLLELQKVEPVNTWKILNAKKFDLFASISVDWSSIIPSVVHSQGVFNFTGLSELKIDQLLNQLPAAFEPQARLKIEKQIAQIIDNLTLKILGFESSDGVYLVSSRIHSAPPDRWSGPFYGQLKNN